MKKSYDKFGRTIYKYSHSVSQGGFLYIHRARRPIENKQGLKNAINAISSKFMLLDPTVKVYEYIFFFFFHVPKSLAPAIVIETIQKNIRTFGEWDSDYVFDGVYDLQENYISKNLEKFEFDYAKG